MLTPHTHSHQRMVATSPRRTLKVKRLPREDATHLMRTSELIHSRNRYTGSRSLRKVYVGPLGPITVARLQLTITGRMLRAAPHSFTQSRHLYRPMHVAPVAHLRNVAAVPLQARP